MTRFKMLARDINSAILQMRTWVVDGYPDFAANLYDGYRSGDNIFAQVSTYAIDDDYAIMDFNLPKPIEWRTIPHYTLPSLADDAELLCLDGYAYLLGGRGSNKILQASLDNPAVWIDTTRTLPTPLYGSHLAVIGNKAYLFGGHDGYNPSNHIYSAYTSDLLTWIDEGSHLPMAVHNGSLSMANGHLYIYGGQQETNVLNTIITATTASPLAWTDTGSHLPTSLSLSQIGYADGYWMMWGGFTAANTPTASIYRATGAAPTVWSIVGTMPYPIYSGQYFTAGAEGYIITDATTRYVYGHTPILQCELSDPLTWVDMVSILPADDSRSVNALVSRFKLMIASDRLWILGGAESKNILVCEQDSSYLASDPYPLAYGVATRTTFNSTDNLNNPFQALGLPYWRTDY